MKKLLLVTTALVGVTMLSAPVAAANIDIDVSGYLKFYGVYADNDEIAGAATSVRDYEFRRNTELHFTGETTLDNGLTVGAVTELRIADAANNVLTDETYGYFSGQWGRVNVGVEDGAAYLLQVAAPSADSNVDGMRVSIQALNPTTLQNTALSMNNGGFAEDRGTADYQHADFRTADRLTYLTPKFNGFQAGASYAPGSNVADNNAVMSLDSNSTDDVENLWEVSARWDGTYQGWGIGLGAGYSTSSQEIAPVTGTDAVGVAAGTAGQYWFTDAPSTWNVGASVAYNGFSLGGAYLMTDTTRAAATVIATTLAADVASGDVERDTWVVGAAYDNGPYHVGASYMVQQTDYAALATAAGDQNIAAGEFEVEKFAVGGGYTFGPGMTFRGAVAWGEFEAPAGGAANNDFTQVTIGTDIQF